MAHVTEKYREDCKCKHGCRTYAHITRWSCGCVEVDISRSQTAGWDCTNFSGMRRSCGKSGRPGD